MINILYSILPKKPQKLRHFYYILKEKPDALSGRLSFFCCLVKTFLGQLGISRAQAYERI
jgi:hypothetical protein